MADGTRKIGAEVFVKATEAKEELQSTAKAVKGVGEAAEKANAVVEKSGAATERSSRAASVAAGEWAKLGSAATAAATGLSSSSNAAVAATGDLLFRQQQLNQEVNRVNAAIKSESASLDLMNRVSARSGDAQALLTDKIKNAERGIIDLLVQKRALGEQAADVSKKLELTANGTSNLGTKAQAASGAFSMLTTQISTGQGIFQGYDSAIQAVLRSTGGIPIVWSLLIGLGSQLLPVLFNLGKAKQEEVHINEAAIVGAIAYANAIRGSAQVAQSYSAALAQGTVAQQGYGIAAGNTITALFQVAQSQATIREETMTVNKAFEDLTTRGYRVAEASIFVSRSTEELREDIKDATKTIDEQVAAMAPHIGALRQMQAMTGATNEELIQFAAKGRASEQQLNDMRAALNGNLPVLQAFASELTKNTSRMVDMERAALSLQLALVNIKPPSFNIDGTLQGIQNAVTTAQAGFDTTAIPKVGALPNFKDRVAANQDNLETVNKRLQAYASFHSAGATATARNADAARIYNEQLRQLNPEIQRGVLEVKAASEVTFNHAKAHHASGSAARSHANELSNLTKRIQDAQAALIADNFASREAKIAADILGEARAAVIKKNYAAANRAEINKMDTLEEVAALGVKLGLNKKYFDDLTKLNALQNQKVAHDRADAERQSNIALQRMQIDLIKDEKTRRDLSLRLDVQEYAYAEREKYGITADSQTRINLYRQILEAQFNEWLIREQRGNWAKQRETRVEEEKKFYNEARKLAIELGRDTRREQQSLAEGVGRKLGFDIGGATVTPEQRKQVEDFVQQMNELHITLRLIDGDYARDAREAQRFANNLKILQAFSKGDVMGGLRASLRAVRDELFKVNTSTDILQNAFESAFASIGQSGTSFVRALGASLISGISQVVAGVLNQIGVMLISKGVADIAMGVAWNANPLTPGLGTALIAAGHNEVTQGAILKVLGGVVSGLGQAAAGAVQNGGNNAAASGAGAGSAASGTTGSTARGDRPSPATTQLPVPSGGNQNRNQNQQINFDARRTEEILMRLLTEKGVVSVDSMTHQHKSQVKSIVKNMAKS